MDLDDGLKDSFYDYLEERGINSELASFIEEYIGYKDQNEYMNWLNQAKEFIKAYQHGIVVNWMDGLERRFYPRILTYSADYPEK